jgi:biotin transport system substrate-specific component
VAGLVTERARLPIGWAAAAGAFLGGIVVLYLLGAAGWALMLGKSMAEVQVFLLGFLPGDLIKVVLAGLITRSVARMRPGSLLSRPA